MIKSLNESLETIKDTDDKMNEKLEARLAEELEERMELGCWANLCFGNS